MSSDTQTGTTLTRVREAQMALEKAQAAMASVQSGLSGVETVSEKTASTRRHPVRNTLLALLVASIAFAVMVAFKTVAD
ncbi:MAG TPA: hypothetical protein VF148_05095 [Acidimicrobiia bacterium]